MNFTADILIPTYNRKKFEQLINHNINIQDYPFIKNILIADDGDDDKLIISTKKYNVLYYNVSRMTIGNKRNYLLDKSTSRYACYMDTDDFYNPSYISSSIYNLINSNKSISGTSDMNIYFNNSYYRTNCIYINLLNEATLVIDTLKIKFRFDDVQTSEGAETLKSYIKDIHLTEIDMIMCCVSHDNNTVPKSHFTQDKNKIKDLIGYDEHIKILSNITI